MGHINCLGSYSLLFIVSCFLSLSFYLVYCIFAAVIVRHLLCFLVAFDCQEIKGLLTYLLTYETFLGTNR